jgi:3,4-dihydroxy 2-butanone 4-phosphate synthase/GTP cyclohydrolase II
VATASWAGANIRCRRQMTAELQLSTIEAALRALRRGEMIVVIDAPNRENEGDLVMAAEMVSADAVNFMATHGRGLICVPMSAERLSELGIPPMTGANRDPLGTAFHVGVDSRERTTTGISASDRAETIRALASKSSRTADFRQPGHVFPLAAREGGVLRRAGHTEAAIDLMSLAGLAPAGLICEISADDGEMERLPGLIDFAKRHGLEIVAISDLIAYRLRTENLVVRTEAARMPLASADFKVIGYRDLYEGREHLALVLGDVCDRPGVLVRMHSECLTGDVFGSLRCDCGAQLRLALDLIASEGRGVVVYLRGHEGRGIGLLNKIHAYRLQDEEGLDTIDANLRLGQPVDRRDYGIGMQILRDLGIRHLRLLSNNPAKRAGLEGYGLAVVDRVPLVTRPTPENQRYLQTKQARLGHELEKLNVGLTEA